MAKRSGGKTQSSSRPRASASAQTWVRPLILDLGCCGASALQIGAPGYDLAGFAGHAYDLEPAQANVLIVAGRISPAFVPTLCALHSQLAAPGWVIAFGVCALSGAVLDTTPVDQIIPVDVMVPGCPPHPEALCHALTGLSRQRSR